MTFLLQPRTVSPSNLIHLPIQNSQSRTFAPPGDCKCPRVGGTNIRLSMQYSLFEQFDQHTKTRNVKKRTEETYEVLL